MTSRYLTRLLIASLALSSVAIPATARTSSPQHNEWCSDEVTQAGSATPGRAPLAAIPAPPPTSKEKRPLPVRNRWRAPSRNLSLGTAP
jgi:hypothetical protein